MWGKYRQNVGNFVGISNQQTYRLRKIGEIELKERSMSELLADRPHMTIDLRKLEDVKIPRTILKRGMNLKAQGRAKRNSLYPWKFMVSGDRSVTGIAAYSVDIAQHTCSCMWFTNTGSTCKHLIAALLVFMEDQIQETTKI